MSRGGEESILRLPKQLLKIHPPNSVVVFPGINERVKLLVKPAFAKDTARNSKCGWLTGTSLAKFPTKKPTLPKTTLGCDPEFVFITGKGSVCRADAWLKHWGEVGHDGPLAELRPKPAVHEDLVVENLRTLIHTLPRTIAAYHGKNSGVWAEGHSEWRNYALGFHIHVGAPKPVLGGKTHGRHQFVRAVAAVLDYFVGIPAMLLENNSVRRLGNGVYGKPSDVRITARTIEYRTPGGFHLRHPSYARGILGLSLCVAHDLLERAAHKSINWRCLDMCCSSEHWLREYNLPSGAAIRRAVLDPNKKRALKLVPGILARLQELPNYKNHTASINTYFNLLLNNTQYSPKLLDNW